MKLVIIYFFGAIGMVSAVKLLPLIPTESNQIKTIEDKYIDENITLELQNKENKKHIANDFVLNKIKPTDEVDTEASSTQNNMTEYIDDGFKRDYSVEVVSYNLSERIYYHISKLHVLNNFYGGVNLLYGYNKYSENQTKRSTSNFRHEYELGFRGFIYSPKLLNYTFSSTLLFDNIKSNVNDKITKGKVEGHSYNASFDFLNQTKIPFSMSIVKNENRTRGFLSDNLSLRLNGRVDLKIFQTSYYVTDTESTTKSLSFGERRKNNEYSMSIAKRKDIHNFRMKYTNLNQIVEKKFKLDSLTDIITKTQINIENIDLIYEARISDNIKFDTRSYYSKTLYSDNPLRNTKMQNITSSSYLSWKSQGKHSALISLTGSTFKENSNDSFTYIQAHQSYSYNVSNNLNISQSLGYSTVFDKLNTEKNMNLNSSINYNTKVTKDTQINLSVNAGTSVNNNDTTNFQTYTYSTSAGVAQVLDSINSNMNVSIILNGSLNSLDEDRKAYGFTFNISTKINSMLRNNLRTNYNKEIFKSLDNNLILIDKAKIRLLLRDGIKYTTRISYKGILTSSINVNYTSTEFDEKKLETLSSNADISFQYRLSKNLNHLSTLNVNKGLLYDTINYVYTSNLSFNSGKMSALVEYEYTKADGIEGVDGSIDLVRDTHRFSMRLSRRF